MSSIYIVQITIIYILTKIWPDEDNKNALAPQTFF